MYIDFLPRIKNAQMAGKESLFMPFSRLDLSIGRVFVESGYVKDIQKKSVGKKNFLEVKLSYKNGRPAVTDFKIMSKPSRHLYFGWKYLRPVKNGYGLGIISTSKGIMTDKEARKNKVGGEYLFQIW